MRLSHNTIRMGNQARMIADDLRICLESILFLEAPIKSEILNLNTEVLVLDLPEVTVFSEI